MGRYKWNAATLGELFDGVPVDQAGPIAQESGGVMPLLQPSEASAAAGDKPPPPALGPRPDAGGSPLTLLSPFMRQRQLEEGGEGAAAAGEEGGGGGTAAQPPGPGAIPHPAAARPAPVACGTEGQHALAAAVRRLGGLEALRSAAAAPAPAAGLGPPPANSRGRQMWQQQQWLAGMSEAKRQRLADVALHVQKVEVGGVFNRACGAGPVQLPAGFDANELLQQPGRTAYRL